MKQATKLAEADAKLGTQYADGFSQTQNLTPRNWRQKSLAGKHFYNEIELPLREHHHA
jgi:hypothetical protein